MTDVEKGITGVHNRSKLYPEGEELPFYVEKTLRNSLEKELVFDVTEEGTTITVMVNRMVNPFGTGSHVILPKYLIGYRVKEITLVRDNDRS